LLVAAYQNAGCLCISFSGSPTESMEQGGVVHPPICRSGE